MMNKLHSNLEYIMIHHGMFRFRILDDIINYTVEYISIWEPW